jgi:hypothetical protein
MVGWGVSPVSSNNGRQTAAFANTNQKSVQTSWRFFSTTQQVVDLAVIE